MNIGFLGLGAMGLPMAKRLLAAGHSLRIAVHANPAPVRELEELGAQAVSDSARVVDGVDVIVSLLPEDKQVVGVLLSTAVMEAVSPGTTIIEMSTTASSTVRLLAQQYAPRSVAVLDAPVSGGVEGAVNGTLTIMCGGSGETLEKSRPVLEALGKRIIHVGDIGAGKDMKAVNNLLSAVNMAAAAEGLLLAKKLGLDLDIAYDVIRTSSGQSFSFDTRFKRMVDHKYEGGFKLWLMMKDMRIALGEAQGLSMPLSHLAYQLYQMSGEKDRDLDYAAVARVFRGLRGGDEQ